MFCFVLFFWMDVGKLKDYTIKICLLGLIVVFVLAQGNWFQIG
jgi:hypothetical protein